ncbi:hypothetical protein ABGV42_14970 [Paenibacillus pabuli]|uniref:hypothetical protein n=1 Tax=Paenibacillus pabuli TaxID=1472 RepID=UPI003242B026
MGIIILTRSEEGFKNKLKECLEIISINIENGRTNKTLTNVLAGQLRLLLCDTNKGSENSLIYKVIENPSMDYVCNNFISFQDTKRIEFIPPTSLFRKDGLQLPLNDWLNQEIIKSNIKYESLTNCVCYYCDPFPQAGISYPQVTLEKDECFISVMCAACGSDFPVNIEEIGNSYEGKIENVEITTITIRDIIKNNANKNGGAHVDRNLDIKGFLCAEIGGGYIESISNYILEYFKGENII